MFRFEFVFLLKKTVSIVLAIIQIVTGEKSNT